MDTQTLGKNLEEYKHTIERLSGLYFYLYRASGDFDLSDLEQAGRIAIFNISRKRPEKLENKAYVGASIRYAIFGEMKKMRRKERHVYLTSEDEGQVQLVDVFPTKEKGERLDEVEELLYTIKHQFSENEAKGLEALLEKCENIFDLNFTTTPSTETKDRVKIVTRMDLTDKEMGVYAEVLLGVGVHFPKGYVRAFNQQNNELRNRACRYLRVVLDTLKIDPRKFAGQRRKVELIRKYRLSGFLNGVYYGRVRDFIMDTDPSINPEDILGTGKWKGQIDAGKISNIIQKFVEQTGKNPSEIKVNDIIDDPTIRRMIYTNKYGLFRRRYKIFIEFAYPGTYPEYRKEVEELRKRIGVQ